MSWRRGYDEDGWSSPIRVSESDSQRLGARPGGGPGWVGLGRLGWLRTRQLRHFPASVAARLDRCGHWSAGRPEPGDRAVRGGGWSPPGVGGLGRERSQLGQGLGSLGAPGNPVAGHQPSARGALRQWRLVRAGPSAARGSSGMAVRHARVPGTGHGRARCSPPAISQDDPATPRRRARVEGHVRR